MSIRSVLFSSLVACGLAFATESLAADWFVNCAVGASDDGKTWQTAFTTIQEGIDAAISGDTVIVAEGTYRENVSLKGKNIVLRGTDPLDPIVVGRTIIDGGRRGSVVTFAGTEKETCLLAGFTIRNGYGAFAAGIYGGTWEAHTHATIRNNVITANSAYQEAGGVALCDGLIAENRIIGNWARYYGGGLDNCKGTIQNNVISGNTVPGEMPGHSNWGGAGLSFCDGTIRGNTIMGNSTQSDGGGLYKCNGTIEGNVIARNSATCQGGGLVSCIGTIRNNVIYGNSASEGGGLADCPNLQSNTIVANSADRGGGTYIPTDGLVRDCIIWGNTAPAGPQVALRRDPSYCCIEDWPADSSGNISAFPHFVDEAGCDYHLKSWSPCIDAGNPTSDFSREPEPNGGRIDIGAYGNTPEATSKSPDADEDSLPDDWEMHFFGDLAQVAEGDTDNDGISNTDEYLGGTRPIRISWYVDRSRPASGDGRSWETAFRTIQEAMDPAYYPDVVTVAQGIYLENIRFKGKDVVLTSTDPLDPTVVANTVIDGSGAGSVVTFEGTEGENCVLAGFTIRNGKAMSGGGICGRTTGAGNRATIRNNVIVGNTATSQGGGLFLCDGLIECNTIKANSAVQHGGGLFLCNGAIRSNTISGNLSQFQGGGLHACSGIIRNNAIIGNSADEGGAVCRCNGTIENNTIVGNSPSGSGAALHDCSGTIRNCIIWGNGGKNQIFGPTVPTYCCIERWTGAGEGNIPYFPYFVDESNGDFHLRSWSPCIDAGDPSSDFSNEPHDPRGGRINIGMYGNTAEATSASEDADEDLLPDDWELLIFGGLAHSGADDLDGDGLTNLAEYLFSTSPTAQGTDGDQMPDAWEVENALDPLTENAAEDADMDGLTNLQEHQGLTDPNNSDSDGDDLSDGAEVNTHRTDPLKADTDSDGKNDSQEVFAGTDPLDEQSLFQIVEIACTPFGTAVRWTVVPGRTYQCYVSPDLRLWSPLGGTVSPGTSISTHSVFDWDSAPLSGRYYRVSVRQ